MKVFKVYYSTGGYNPMDQVALFSSYLNAYNYIMQSVKGYYPYEYYQIHEVELDTNITNCLVEYHHGEWTIMDALWDDMFYTLYPEVELTEDMWDISGKTKEELHKEHMEEVADYAIFCLFGDIYNN